jgi:hypothetical protein
MPWGTEEPWPGGLGFSGRPVKSGGAGAAAVAGGGDVARNARGSWRDAAGNCEDVAAAAAGSAAVAGCPCGGEAMACGCGAGGNGSRGPRRWGRAFETV